MIKPSRYLDLDTCPLNVGALVLEYLRDKGPLKYAELASHTQEMLGDMARFHFSPALSLLYLLGLIEYDESTDTFIMQDVDSQRSQGEDK